MSDQKSYDTPVGSEVNQKHPRDIARELKIISFCTNLDH